MSPEDEKFAELMARQEQLEARLLRLEEQVFPRPVVEEVPVVAAVPVLAVPEPETAPLFLAPAAVIEETPALESKVGLTWLNRIGVITLVLGVAFFFKWAVDNNWIGAAGRVLLGLLAGFLTLGFADYLWRKGQQIYAQGITGAGVAIVYISLYAAFDFYHLVPQAVAFLLLLATTVMAAALAMRYDSLAIAALGFFGAYVIPLLLSNGENHPWFLMSYLAALNLAATELAARRGWKILEVLSFLATVLIFGGWVMGSGARAENRFAATVGVLVLGGQRFRTVIPVLFLLAQALTTLSLAFVWANDAYKDGSLVIVLLLAMGGLAFSQLRRYSAIVMTVFGGFWVSVAVLATHPASYMTAGSAGFLLFAAWSWWHQEEATTEARWLFALNGVIYYSLAYYLLHREYHDWLGLLAVAVAASYLAFGMAVYRKKNSLDADLVMLALGVSAAFLTLAIPIQLSGFRITIAWAIQAAALTWIGVRLKKGGAVIGALFLFALAFLQLAAKDAAMYPDVNSYSLLFNTRFFVFVVVAAALLLSAHWVSKFEPQLALAHFVAGHLVLLGGLCLEVIGWAGRNAQPENLTSVETIGITILLAVYAVALVSIGVARRSGVHRIAGLVLTAVVVLKLYVNDVWQLGRVYQIIAFVILGILLLSTSFLYSRFKGLIDGWKKDETAGF